MQMQTKRCKEREAQYIYSIMHYIALFQCVKPGVVLCMWQKMLNSLLFSCSWV